MGCAAEQVSWREEELWLLVDLARSTSASGLDPSSIDISDAFLMADRLLDNIIDVRSDLGMPALSWKFHAEGLLTYFISNP